MRRLLTDRAGLAVFTAALVVQMIGLAQFWAESPFARNLILDAHRYDAEARAIANGAFPVEAVFHQAPFYPHAAGVVYALSGGSTGTLLAIQAVLGAISAFLLYRVGRRHFGRPVGVVASLLAMFCLPLLAFSSRVLPTVWIVALELLLLDAVPAERDADARRWVLPGLVAGVLALARPSHLLLVPAALALVFIRRLPLRSALAFAAACALTVMPATLHNFRAGGGFVPISSNGGETFFHGNNSGAAGGYSLMAGLESASILDQERVSREIAERARGRALRAAEVSSYWFERGLAFIREDPGAYVRLELAKLRLLAGGDEAPDIYSPSLEASLYTPLYRIGFARLPALLPFAIAGVVILGRRIPPWLAILLAMHVATMLAFYVSNRYRAPMEVLLLLPAAYALVHVRERRTRLWLLPGAAILLTLLATATPETPREARAKVLVNLGASLGTAGNYARAEDVFRQALAYDPSWARAHHYLGRTLAMQRKNLDAIDSYARASLLAPDAADVRLDLVAALLRAGRTGDAGRQLAVADSLLGPGGPEVLRRRVASLRESLAGATAPGVEP